MLSKESCVKRVMSDVFPTLCSPKNTNLNLRRGFPNSLEFDMMMLFFSVVYCVWFEKNGEEREERGGVASARLCVRACVCEKRK